MEEKNIKFEDLGLSENVLRALEEYGYKKPTEIQVKTIPYILDKKRCHRSITNRNRKNSFIRITINRKY